MAAAKKKTPANSVVALETHIGETLVIRANPSDTDVANFVKEHTRRYIAGEPGGPSGISAFRIFNAKRYTDEEALLNGEKAIAEIDISALLPTS